jgi:hypothetical protein
MNTSILYPNFKGPHEEVTFILYYVDVDHQLGATYVVSRQYSRDKPLVPYVLHQNRYPELYLREQPICVRAGSLLIYSMATVHRASRITLTNRTRYSHHIVYRSEDAPWVGYRVWANYGLSHEMQRFMEQASPRQRELLGFPAPSHRYWNEETLAGIAARYPGMDMRPYLETAGLSSDLKDRLRETLQQPRSSDTGLETSGEDASEHPAENTDWAVALAYHYCRGVADFYASVTGTPTGYWLLSLFQAAGISMSFLAAYLNLPKKPLR